MLLLDAASGSYLDEELLNEYCHLRHELPWNPHGVTLFSEKGQREIARAELRILEALGLSEAEFSIVWTANATESLNLAVSSFGETNPSPFFLCDSCAHPAMIEPIRHAASRFHGFIRMIPVDSYGQLCLPELPSSSPYPFLSCVCLVNNETGIIQKLHLLRALHGMVCLDATQAIGKISLDCLRALSQISYIAFSGRKLGVPVSVGALIVRKSIHLVPQLVGGGQQGGRRSGTLDAAAISVLAHAVERAVRTRERFHEISKAWNVRLREMLAEIFGERLFVFSPIDDAIPSILLAGIRDVEGALVARVLAEKFDILVGTGSACSAESGHTSHVLSAMGIPDDVSRSAVRFSFPPDFNESTGFPVLQNALKELCCMSFVSNPYH